MLIIDPSCSQAKATPSPPNQFGRNPLEDAYREKQRDVTKLLELWKKQETEAAVERGAWGFQP